MSTSECLNRVQFIEHEVNLNVAMLKFQQFRFNVRILVNIKSLRILEFSFLLRVTSCVLYLIFN